MTERELFLQTLTLLEAGEGVLCAEALVPEGSAWYSGHFPGQPILPGIAILGLAAEAIRMLAGREGRSFTLTGVGRVRFRLPAVPGARMTIQVRRETRGGGSAYAFTVTLNGDSLCSGLFTGAEGEPGEQNP